MSVQSILPHPTDNRSWFHRALAVTAGGGIVVGALVLGAPTASAEPDRPIKESTIKSECRAAGGTYSTSTVEGTRFTGCRYKDNEGNPYTDYYVDGKYYSTRPR
jgi:hypothetical protein